ncbi:MAG: hypothetical protein JSS81_18265 [Acidobacteria bacterium]|nr:hypothetical protein [Acidobacteriota bacterium]
MKNAVSNSFFPFLILLFLYLAGSVPDVFTQSRPKTETILQTDRDAETILSELLSDKTRNLHQWSSINQFHGLPSERVNSIVQTPDGIMWFATDAGLAKFDGRRIQSVSPDNFLNRRILSLAAAPGGELWIGTENGLFYYANDRFRFVEPTAEMSVRAVSATADAGVFIKTEGDPNPAYGRIDRNPAGDFVLFELDKAPPELKTAAGPLPKAETVTATAADADGNLWFGTRDRGVFLYRGADEIAHYTLENTAGGLRSNEILSVFIDPENVVWFGTVKGVSRFDPNSPLSEQFASGTNSDFIRTIFSASNGLIYAGTQQGLFVNGAAGDWGPVPGFERKRIFAVSEAAPNQLLVGTSRGLLFYPPIRGSTEKFNGKSTESYSGDADRQSPAGSIRSIQHFQNDIFLGIFGQGLARLENKTPVTVPDCPGEARNVTSLKADGGRLWIGTAENGVFVYDGTRFYAPPELESLKNRAIWTIDGHFPNNLWFGTEKGLYLLRNGELTAVSSAFDVRGLALAADDGVWCATEKNGLVRFAEDPNFGWISSRLDVEQGLPSQKVFSVYRQPDGMILIGTTRGVVRFKPPKMKPLLVVTSILSRRIHELAELKSTIALEFPQNTLSVEVSAINSRTFPEQFQYGYLLKNSEGAVVRKKFGKEVQFLMDNLPAGEYAVEIRAYDKTLLASDPLFFSFRVGKAPFPWITLLLTTLLLFTLLALVWAVLSQRKIFQKSSELNRAHQDLNAARMDLANEAERERRRISRDLHDQTLADLRHLQLLADKIPESPALPETARTLRVEIESVSHEIRRICEDLSPSVLENIGFSAALEWVLKNTLSPNVSGRKIAYDFQSPENLDDTLSLSHTEQIQIFRIVQEVLNNISRHSEATRVSLAIEIADSSELILEIVDDGGRFDFEEFLKREGRGLSNVKSRVRLIEADFSFRTLPAGGTVFRLTRKTTPVSDPEDHPFQTG